ncbi:MAG TPA: DNA polymerase/3'-5' exonuclease PolX [Candidatus Eisenbacteria bacterium]|nr:DNA polymerase/3'-5' exonuclease PolX [Candidatus Eisenbacteria bacterium]
MDKRDVARTLEEIAVLLELTGENPFKVRAYESAARAVDGLAEDLGGVVSEARLTEIGGIGASIASKIAELWTTGRMTFHDELVAKVPPGYIEMSRIPGLGPKKIRALGEALHVTSVADLKTAAETGRIRGLKGFGEQSERKILKGIAVLELGSARFLAGVARPIAEELLEGLKRHPAVEQAEVGGSLRRGLETVKDIDLLVATKKPADVTQAFLALVPDASIIGSGETKTSVRLPSGLAVDIRLVLPTQFPFALHYFTGNVAHNVRVRSRAIDRGFSLNEYELSGKRHAAIANEADLFKVLGLAYIEPELREDLGEIEAAEKGALPDLITLDDMRGILHCHTTYSDGKSTLVEMANAAEAWGASYLGISDHSQSARFYANGLTEEDLLRQEAEIDAWNKKSKQLRILKGAEVDILPDGSLDYADKILSRLDFVVASIHASLMMDEKAMTARIVKALRNKHVNIFAHPTGRILLQRDGYKFKTEEVFRVAAGEGVAVEVNANTHRLDLDWREIRAAKARGVTFAINPDAHHVTGYDDIRFGVGVARKGWLTKGDVVNTLPVDRAIRLFRARR